MPRYFFNVGNMPPSLDTVGEELPDDEAAWVQATTFASDILKDVDGRLRPGQSWALNVTDQSGLCLFQIQISTSKRE